MDTQSIKLPAYSLNHTIYHLQHIICNKILCKHNKNHKNYQFEGGYFIEYALYLKCHISWLIPIRAAIARLFILEAHRLSAHVSRYSHSEDMCIYEMLLVVVLLWAPQGRLLMDASENPHYTSELLLGFPILIILIKFSDFEYKRSTQTLSIVFSLLFLFRFFTSSITTARYTFCRCTLCATKCLRRSAKNVDHRIEFRRHPNCTHDLNTNYSTM